MPLAEMFVALEELGLNTDEMMLYEEVNRAAKHAHSLPEMRQNERDDFVRDFQRILERILARAGHRRLDGSVLPSRAGIPRKGGGAGLDESEKKGS